MSSILLVLSISHRCSSFCKFFSSTLQRLFHNTAWKVSKYGVFSGPYFPDFSLLDWIRRFNGNHWPKSDGVSQETKKKQEGNKTKRYNLPYKVCIPKISSYLSLKPGWYFVYQGYIMASLTSECSKPNEWPETKVQNLRSLPFYQLNVL